MRVDAVDLRAYHPLARLRRIIRAYVVVEGLLLAAIIACLWFWFSMALDFGVHQLGFDMLDHARPVRWVVMIVFVAGMSAVVGWYIMRRLFRDFTPASLALVLEKRFPGLLGDRLITAVELVDLKKAEKQGYSVEMIVKTMKDAKERVDTVPVHSVFNWTRLLLLVWSLVGVTVLLLLLSYPIGVLFSLFDEPRGKALWTMLVVNLLLVFGIVAAYLTPCLYVWMRKSNPTARTFVASAGGALALFTAFGFVYAHNKVNNLKEPEFSWHLYHASNISLDRNLRFMETRWPKDEYFVDWLDFPVDEKRIQIGKTINARAYFTTWIIADDKAPNRWRPVVWSDLPKLVAKNEIPNLPIERIHAYMLNLTAGDERSPVGFDKTTLQLPKTDEVPVNLVMSIVGDFDSTAVTFSDDERDEFAHLAKRLNAEAADPKLGGRLIRKVRPPENLELIYGETPLSVQKGRSVLAVSDDRKNVFSLEQPVKLDDTFVVRVYAPDGQVLSKRLASFDGSIPIHAEVMIDGQVMQTPLKKISLVRPPKVQQFDYQEFRPAYYYYLPPTSPRADTIDQRRRLLRDFRQALIPIRQTLPAESVSVEITSGSELVMRATADKKLQEVTLTPRSPDFPGCAAKEDVVTVPLQIMPDGKSFVVNFTQNGKTLRDWVLPQWYAALPVTSDSVARKEWLTYLPVAPSWAVSPFENPTFMLVNRTMTFDVTMKDVDNMTSNRTFTVRPLDDKLPSVSLYVDVIRQVQANDRTLYICTAKAEIPFTKESMVSDDIGLHKVEFTYEYIALANATITAQRAELASWLWASTPLMPSIADYIFRREILLRTVSGAKGPPPIKGTLNVDSFYAAQGKVEGSFLSVDQLREKVREPVPRDYPTVAMKRYDFKDGERQIMFDLRDRLPRLADKDAAGGQPNYELILNVRATDSNVLAEFERTAENKEAALTFKIVSESELFAIISREESDLARRFDELIKKLETAQRNLQAQASRVPSLSRETSTSEQTRLEGIIDTVVKSREQTGEIHTAYSRILREYQINRFPDQLTRGVEGKIVEPMAKVQVTEFPQAEEELTKFFGSLKEANPAIAQALTGPVLFKIQALLDRLRAIRANMGETLDLNKAILKIQAIIAGANEINKDDLATLHEKLLRELLWIQFDDVKDVTMGANQKAKVTLKIKMPKTITTDPLLRFEIPTNSGLKIAPIPVKLTDNSEDATFEITAGAATGTFSLRITPTQGKPVDLKVVVK